MPSAPSSGCRSMAEERNGRVVAATTLPNDDLVAAPDLLTLPLRMTAGEAVFGFLDGVLP